MIVITMKSQGLDELGRRYHEAPNIVQALITLAITKSTADVHKKLRTYTQGYPRQRYSSYIRTFALRGSSQARILDKDTGEASIGHGIDYADRVMGYATQWGMHKAMGWWTNESVAKNMRGVIGKHFMDSANQLVTYLGP